MKYDYLIIGAGFYGAICARQLTDAGYKCLVIDKRNHIGGNCYTEQKDGINIHTYGPHIFHTSDEEVWNWINQYVKFNSFTYRPVANYKGDLYSLPFNMWTFTKLWEVTTPQEAKEMIERQSNYINEPKNLEEQAIKLVGKDVYNKLIKGYTAKQWKKDPKELPASIIKRLPVRFTFDNNYFNDKYQGIPVGGYTQIFEKLLEGIDVKLEIDYLENKEHWNLQAKKIIYTGPIDAFYDYKFGELEYKTVGFEHKRFENSNYQGIAVMNYTSEEIPFTRVIEHKHFDMIESDVTHITWEYPIDYKARETEAMYPVNDAENNAKYQKYRDLANQESNIIFGGRLGEYKYYDMHQVIKTALQTVKKELDNYL